MIEHTTKNVKGVLWFDYKDGDGEYLEFPCYIQLTIEPVLEMEEYVVVNELCISSGFVMEIENNQYIKKEFIPDDGIPDLLYFDPRIK